VGAEDVGDKLKKDELAAQEMAQRFKDIMNEVAGFKARLNAYWKSVQQALANEITQLDNRITQLEADLAAFQKGVSLLVLIIWAYLTVLFLSPLFIFFFYQTCCTYFLRVIY
jgi:predicted PurR-regulated permease PerM